MKIAFCSTEVVPYVKVGGLADVSGALPKEIFSFGQDIKIFLPKYKKIDSEKFGLKPMNISYEIKLAKKKYKGSLWSAFFPRTQMQVVFIDCPELYDRNEVYGEKGGDYPDSLERFAFFNLSVLESFKLLNWKADIIHCNDWPTGLLPVYLKNVYNKKDGYNNIGTLMTIHNVGYQGMFPEKEFKKLDLPKELYKKGVLEFFGRLNLLQGGLVFADKINAVSVTYSKEIETKEYGCGMEDLLVSKKEDVTGILNGVDYHDWSPEVDELIPQKFSKHSLEGKAVCKKELQKMCGLPESDCLLAGMVTRLADQKGLDLVAEIMEKLLDKFDFQLVILGTGDPKYEKFFKELHEKFPEKVYANIAFDNKFAHCIEAGADMFLMPSLYEPCGLNQIYSLKYAALPLVRKTGGLADTIIDYDANTDKANGFAFVNYNSRELEKTFIKAFELFKDKEIWSKLMLNAMSADFSWTVSAKKYMELYQEIRDRISKQ